MVAVGHELSHKEKEYPWLLHWGCDKKFISQTNEVLADFTGAERMVHSSREDLLRSILYKRQHRISMGKADAGDPSHPSWTRRAHYVANYDFGPQLIEQIACDVNCYNKKLISNVIAFYSQRSIVLNPPIQKDDAINTTTM